MTIDLNDKPGEQTTIDTALNERTSARGLPKVSVVIPAYNHSQYIRHTIDSVLSQTYPNIEIVVVNDGSPDDTEQVLDGLITSEKIRYFRQKNHGQYHARNRGFQESIGKYIAFLDDDDLWGPNRIASHVAVLEDDEEIIGTYGAVMCFRDTPQSQPVPDIQKRLIRDDFLEKNRLISPGATLLRRTAVEHIGGFERIPGGADDWDFWLRLTGIAPLKGVAGVSLYYREHATNASHDSLQMLLSGLEVCRRHHRDLPLCERRKTARALLDYIGHRVINGGFHSLRKLQVSAFWRQLQAFIALWHLSGYDRTFLRPFARASLKLLHAQPKGR